jgi:hypothetical protein
MSGKSDFLREVSPFESGEEVAFPALSGGHGREVSARVVSAEADDSWGGKRQTHKRKKEESGTTQRSDIRFYAVAEARVTLLRDTSSFQATLDPRMSVKASIKKAVRYAFTQQNFPREPDRQRTGASHLMAFVSPFGAEAMSFPTHGILRQP